MSEHAARPRPSPTQPAATTSPTGETARRDRPQGIRRLKVCLNGGRQRSEHPAVPLTPAELAASGRAAVEAGAEAIHLHPRAPGGKESLLAADIGPAVATVRRSCPGTPIGVSTGLWITHGDVARRLAWVSHWGELDPAHRPNFASVNLSEPGVTELVATLAEAGIGAEAGVWSVADVKTLADAGSELGWLRILVEVLDRASDQAVDEGNRPRCPGAAARRAGIQLALGPGGRPAGPPDQDRA